MNADNLGYLKRAFERLEGDAVAAARLARDRALALGAKQGFSGNTLVSIGDGYARAGSEAMEKMARLTYEVCETTEGPACDVLEQELRALRDRLSNDLADFFRTIVGRVPSAATDAVGNGFLNALDQRIAAIADDFRHGLLGGKRLSKDPLVSVVTSVSNSPGAMVQGGLGNTQTVLTTAQTLINPNLHVGDDSCWMLLKRLE